MSTKNCYQCKSPNATRFLGELYLCEKCTEEMLKSLEADEAKKAESS
jgi:ribosomal protein L37AE/L43A